MFYLISCLSIFILCVQRMIVAHVCQFKAQLGSQLPDHVQMEIDENKLKDGGATAWVSTAHNTIDNGIYKTI